MNIGPCLGIGLGLPQFRGGGGPTPPPAGPFDPSTLPWNSGAKRYWWHIDQPNSLFQGVDGSGSPSAAIGDPVASLVSGAGSDTYVFNQVGGPSGVLRTDGVEFTHAAHYGSGTFASTQDDSVTGGFTVGFCGYLSAGALGTLLQIGGQDYSPRDHSVVLISSGAEIAAWTWATYSATIDWSIPHRVIGVGQYVGGTVTVKLYIDGALVLTQTGKTAGTWNRDRMYVDGASAVWNIRSRFYASQAFTSDANIALIDRFLCLGATPMQVTGGWTAWIESFKASLLDYGYAEDLTRLWTTEARTTNVAAAGDVVGAWRGQKDVLTFEQSNASFRFTYRTAGVEGDATGGTTKRLYAAFAHNYNAPLSIGIGLYNISTTQPMRIGLQDTNSTTNLPLVGWTQTAGVQAVRFRGTSTNMATANGRRAFALSFGGASARAIDSFGVLSSPAVGSGTTNGTHLVMAASASGGKGYWNTWVVKLGTFTDEELTRLQYWLRYRRHLE